MSYCYLTLFRGLWVMTGQIACLASFEAYTEMKMRLKDRQTASTQLVQS